jgi:hypothetical protein
MLRKLPELGGYHHVMYVSHAEDAVEADTIIDMSDGRPTVRRIA